MTKFSILASLAVIALLLAIPAVVLAQAQPPRPAVFAGIVSLDGAAAPDGTTVSAWIDGEEVASTTSAGGTYGLTIAQPPGGAFAGKEVIFMVGSSESLERGTWEADGGAELNLSASSSMMRRGPASVGTAWAGLAQYLVDRDGLSLYLYTKDTPGSGESACTSAGCLRAWPPLVTEGAPTAMAQPELRRGVGAVADHLGSIERTDGGVTTNQVTYNGWPLYYYILDEKPGDVVGQYGSWYLVAPQGTLLVGGSNVDPAGGAAGPEGPEGPAGPAGPGGAPGPAGPRGADGADGAAGAAGARGSAGSAGSAGPAGPAGADGAAGSAGSAGSDGSAGSAGPAGPAGASGGGGLAIVALIIAIVAGIGAGGAYVMGRRS